MGIAAKLVTDNAEELLRAPRATSEAGGTIRGAEAHTFDIVVKDLSRTGCLVETRAVLAIGSIVQIRITGVPQSGARVVRQDRAGYGCEFLRELTSADLDASGEPAPLERPVRGRSPAPALIVAVAAGLAILAAGPWSMIGPLLSWIGRLRG
jgi:hypothetical protein